MKFLIMRPSKFTSVFFAEFFLLTVLVCGTFADSPKNQRPIDIVREAYLGAKENLVSGAGTGIYEHYSQKRGDSAMSLCTLADAKIWFDKGKYHVFLKYKKNIKHISSSRIIFDGELLINTEEYTVPGTKKLQTRSQIYPSTAKFGSPEDAGFPFNPSRLPDSALYLGPKSGNRWDVLTITTLANGGYLGRCPFRQDRMEFDFLPKFGFNASSSRIYNEGSERPVAESHVLWDQADGVWYVKSISDSFFPHSYTASKNVLTYSQFQPNLAIDPGLFQVSALQMSTNSPIIDRRPDAVHKVYRNQPSRETTTAEVDSMAEYIKTLPPRETGRRHRLTLPIGIWWLLSGTVLIMVGFIWKWRRQRISQKSNSCSESHRTDLSSP